MNLDRIDGVDDPRVAAYRNVRDGELMRMEGLFVAEGRHVVRRVLQDGRYRVQSILVNDAALRDLEAVFSSVGADVPILAGDAKELAAIAGYDVHRGCLALVRRPAPSSVDSVVAAATLLVVIEEVANADNIGGIFRNAAAFGADGVLLSPGCCDPLYRKAIRTSMGAALTVPFASAAAGDWPRALARLTAAGLTTIALTLRDPSMALREFELPPDVRRVALILGNEGHGLSAAVESSADHRVRIAMSNAIDSLNVAVASGIALHELRTRALRQPPPAAVPPPTSAGRRTAS